MQKRRKKYIIAMIIITVLLVADLAVFVLTKPKTMNFDPSQMQQNIEQTVSSSSTASDQAADGQKGQSGSGDGTQQAPPSMPGGSDSGSQNGQSGSGDGTQQTPPSMPGGSDSDGQDGQRGSGDGTQQTPPSMPGGSDSDGQDGQSTSEDGTQQTPPSMPDGTDMQMPSDMGQVNANPWRIICIPIAIICVVADIVLLILLLRLKKKESAEGTNAEETGESTAVDAYVDPVELRMKKRKRNRIVIAIFLIVLLILVVVLNKLSSDTTDASSANVDEKVMDTTAEKGEISRTLQGSGVVASVEKEDVTVPGDIKVKEYFVSNGDQVSAGDKIASVDKTSVLAAMGDIEDLMDDLDEKLMEVKDASSDQEIDATASARVVAVYAAKGDDVVDTMYDNSALMILSLDGKLSVDLDYSGKVASGDTVTVTDSSGNSDEGTIIDVRKKSITVTVDCTSFTYGDTVSVTLSDGTSVGSGKLGVYNGQKVTAYMGTVSKVYVSVGQKVSEGTALLKLTDMDYTAEYETLLSERDDLQDQYDRLVEISRTGYVCADKDGVISDINEDIEKTSSSTTTESTSSDKASSDSTDESGKTSTDKTSSTATTTSAKAGGSAAGKGSTAATTAVVATGRAAESSTENYGNTSAGTSATTAVKTSTPVAVLCNIQDVNAETQESAELSSSDVQSSSASADSSTESDSTTTDSNDQSSTGTTDSGSSNATDATNTGTTESSASQSSVETTSITVKIDWGTTAQADIPEKVVVTVKGSVNDELPKTYEITLSADNNWEVVKNDLPKYSNGSEITYTVEQKELTESGFTIEKESTYTFKISDSPSGSDDQKSDDKNKGSQNQGGQGGMPSGGSISGFSDSAAMSGMSGMSASGSADASAAGTADVAETEEEDSQYLMDETKLCGVTPDDKVTVDITIDELDILNVEEGQKCTVTMDALEGQSFDGVITKRNSSSSNSGGNTKYTVTVQMDKAEDLLLGMNATVSIPLETKSDVITIPESALVEENGSVFVYTGYDEKKDELTDPVEVTTGASDGENVEITDGLEEGQQIYYKYADTISYTFAK